MLFDKEEGMDEEIKSGLNAPFGARCFLTLYIDLQSGDYPMS